MSTFWMLKFYSTLMNPFYYFSVLSHRELLIQVFKNVNLWNFCRFSIPERQLLAGELIGSFEQEGQVAEEQGSPAGTVMRKSTWKSLFWALGWLYSHEVQRVLEKKAYNLITRDVKSSRTYLSFQVFAELGRKTIPLCPPPSHTVTSKTEYSKEAFFPRWILTENRPCPECLRWSPSGVSDKRESSRRSFQLLKAS